MVLRRSFLKTIGCTFLGLWLSRLGKGQAGSNGQLRFFLAGVRYQESQPRLAPGDPLWVRRELVQNKPSYALYSDPQTRIGYLPKHFVRRAEQQGIREAHIVQYRPHGFPWKRYRAALQWQNA